MIAQRAGMGQTSSHVDKVGGDGALTSPAGRSRPRPARPHHSNNNGTGAQPSTSLTTSDGAGTGETSSIKPPRTAAIAVPTAPRPQGKLNHGVKLKYFVTLIVAQLMRRSHHRLCLALHLLKSLLLMEPHDCQPVHHSCHHSRLAALTRLLSMAASQTKSRQISNLSHRGQAC